MVRAAHEPATPKMLSPQDASYWNAVQVYPDAISEGVARDYRAQALSQLKKSGKSNLRLLLERTLLKNPADITPERAAADLLAADSSLTLLCLADFVRGKGRAIMDEYADHFSPSKQRKHSSQLDELSQGRKASLKQITKLLLLYEDDNSAIERIFTRKLWRGRRTTSEFLAAKSFDGRLRNKLEKRKSTLVDAIADAFNGLDLRTYSTVSLGKWDIMLIQREYAPQVRPDYRDTQKTLHGFGWILLGLERSGSRLLLKGGGKKVIPIVQKWFDSELECPLAVTESDAFHEYNAKTVEDALLGRYSSNCAVQVTGMSFARSLLPSHSALTLKALFPGHDIRKDLEDGREKGLLRVRSLSDIAKITLAYEKAECEIEVVVEPGGGVVLRLDNSDLTEDQVDGLRNEFSEHFGIPIDRRIDPQNLLLGAVDVYNHLLETDIASGLAQYQQNALDHLVAEKVLEEVPEQNLVCPKQPFVCKVGGRPVADEDIAECPECQAELELRTFIRIRHNDSEIHRRAGSLLARATGWKFSRQARKFEGKSFFPLFDPKRPDRQIRIFFAKRVGVRLLECLDRSLQPVLVVHTGGDVEHAHMDGAGVAHVSFARALAADVDKDVKKRFNADVKHARDELLRSKETRVQRQAGIARKRVHNPPDDYNGSNYELDVFYILRSLFPYSEYWAGTNRPDGFCSLVYYEDGDLRNTAKCNWSYDAKFTRDESGYDLDVGEERKIWDYVAALLKQPELQSGDNRLNGHAIISNCVSDGQKSKVAQFVRKQHRLGKKHSDVKVVFIDDTFLIALYDSVMSNYEAYRRRWPFLSRRLAETMSVENEQTYVQLGEAEARSLWEWVAKRSPIDNPPDMQLLREDLDETMTKA